MEQEFNINNFSELSSSSSQYEGQLKRLTQQDVKIESIERTINSALDNLEESLTFSPQVSHIR